MLGGRSNWLLVPEAIAVLVSLITQTVSPTPSRTAGIRVIEMVVVRQVFLRLERWDKIQNRQLSRRKPVISWLELKNGWFQRRSTC